MKNDIKDCDYLIVGSGITGLTIANELVNRGAENIIVIEKENSLGKHASGRNSGVLHSGIYYTPDSLKARYCVEGNRLLKEFCLDNGINLNICGKVLVADSEKKFNDLLVIKDRAEKNGVTSKLISAKELKEIEPNAYTYKQALYSPNTAVFNPKEILSFINSKLIEEDKCSFLFNTTFIRSAENSTAITNNGKIKYKYLINAAGSFADKIAKQFGVGNNYKLIPFMGTYLELVEERSSLVNSNIYPVPDIENPFLGIHFTKSIEGKVYIGPNAFPVFGRENYSLFEGLSLESFDILLTDIQLFFSNSAFRSNAISEMKKYFSDYLFDEARKLVPSLRKEYIKPSAKKGIRPQLIDVQKKQLVMDFVVKKEANTIHVLNAISPAFTSSMAFSKYVCDMID